jgi:hypothetical protein
MLSAVAVAVAVATVHAIISSVTCYHPTALGALKISFFFKVSE